MWDQYSLIKTACNYFRNTCRGRAKMGKDMLSFRPTLCPLTINTQECCRKYNNHHNGSDSKESAYSVGDLGLIPGLGRSPGGEHGNPLQNSCLESPRGSRSLAGCSPWGRKASDTTERLSTQQKHVHPAWVQRLGIPACRAVQTEAVVPRAIARDGDLQPEGGGSGMRPAFARRDNVVTPTSAQCLDKPPTLWPHGSPPRLRKMWQRTLPSQKGFGEKKKKSPTKKCKPQVCMLACGLSLYFLWIWEVYTEKPTRDLVLGLLRPLVSWAGGKKTALDFLQLGSQEADHRRGCGHH